MKVKNENISEESKNQLKAFRKNQILMNIRLHKIFLVMTVLVDLGLFLFLIFYDKKIRELNILLGNHSSNANTKSKENNQKHSLLNHKIVNVIALSFRGESRLSLLFRKSDEFQFVKKIVFDYLYGDKQSKTVDDMKGVLLYQSDSDSHNYWNFMDHVVFYENLLIMVETHEEHRFGIFFKDLVLPNDNEEFFSDSKNIFLISLDIKKTFPFIGEKHSMAFQKNKILVLGDDEMIIYDKFYNNGGFFNFPFKSFDTSTIEHNIFTGNNGQFNIRNLEVYAFY